MLSDFPGKEQAGDFGGVEKHCEDGGRIGNGWGDIFTEEEGVSGTGIRYSLIFLTKHIQIDPVNQFGLLKLFHNGLVNFLAFFTPVVAHGRGPACGQGL